MARKTENKTAKTAIATRVDAHVQEALEEYRWRNRLTMGALLEEIITDWAAAEGLIETPAVLDTDV